MRAGPARVLEALRHDLLQPVSLDLGVLGFQPFEVDPFLLQQLGDLLKLRAIGRHEPR